MAGFREPLPKPTPTCNHYIGEKPKMKTQETSDMENPEESRRHGDFRRPEDMENPGDKNPIVALPL